MIAGAPSLRSSRRSLLAPFAPRAVRSSRFLTLSLAVPVGINSVALSLITDHLKTAMEGGKGYMKTPFDEDNQRERGLGSRENSVGAKMNLMAEMR